MILKYQEFRQIRKKKMKTLVKKKIWLNMNILIHKRIKQIAYNVKSHSQ